MWAEKKSIVAAIDEKYADQKHHQMVPYIMGKKKFQQFFFLN